MTDALNWFIPIAIFCAALNFSMGANDESMGTPYGSRALTIKTALILGAITEVAGSVLFGRDVATTIQGKLFSLKVFGNDSAEVMIIVLAAVIGATFWLVLSSWWGLPTSSTHSIVGAVCIAAMASHGVGIVAWKEVGKIVLSWVLSPLLGGAVVCVIYLALHVLLLWNRARAYERVKFWMPLIVFVCVTTLGMFIALKGIKLPKTFKPWKAAVITLGVAAFLSILTKFLLMPFIARRIEENEDERVFPDTYTDARAEKLFAYLQILSACLFSFARGSNDSSHGAGPFALAYSVYGRGSKALKEKQREVDTWVLAIGGVAMAIGLMILGKRVVQTVGDSLTKITPSSGVMTELATAVVVLGFSALGLPISSTHTLVGTIYIKGVFRKHIIERWFVEEIPTDEAAPSPNTSKMLEKMAADQAQITPNSESTAPSEDVAQLPEAHHPHDFELWFNSSAQNSTHSHHSEPTAPKTDGDIEANKTLPAAEKETQAPTSDDKETPADDKPKTWWEEHAIIVKIVSAWVITIPVSGAVAALAYKLLSLAKSPVVHAVVNASLLNMTNSSNSTI